MSPCVPSPARCHQRYRSHSPSPIGRDALTRVLATPASQPFRSFYHSKLAGADAILALYSGTALHGARAAFFLRSRATWDNVRQLNKLPARLGEGPGPFLGGARPGVDDFHVSAWLARIAHAAGAGVAAEGIGVLGDALGTRVPRQVSEYWDAWALRPSWRTVYSNQLHRNIADQGLYSMLVNARVVYCDI